MHAPAPRLAVLAIGLTLAAPRAWADEVTARMAEGFVATALAAELLTPDLRIEWAEQTALTLSWPLVLASATLVRGERGGVGLLPFLEPQFRPAGDVVRIAAGTRLTFYSMNRELQLAPLLEGGAVAGSDGAGGFAGAGLAIRAPEVGITLGLVGRATWTGDGNRQDIALDLQIPLASDEY